MSALSVPVTIVNDHYKLEVKNDTKLAADTDRINLPPPPCSPDTLVPTTGECKVVVQDQKTERDSINLLALKTGIAGDPAHRDWISQQCGKVPDDFKELKMQMQALQCQFQDAMTALRANQKPKEPKPPKPTLQERMAKLSDRQLLESIFLQVHKLGTGSRSKPASELTNTLSKELNNRL